MENSTSTPAKQQSESLLIRNCSIIEQKTDEGMKKFYVLHTSPSKTNPPKEGEKVSRFKIADAVFQNMAKNQGKPAILFMKEVIGGTYNLTTQFVKEGEAWLRGEGKYKNDHHAKVTESVNLSSAVIAEDTQALRTAYYANLFGTTNPIAAPAAINVAPVANVSGDDIPA